MARFDSHAVRAAAGDTAFERGAAYFRDGLVEILKNGQGRVSARVAGTEEYSTRLTGGGTEIDGECSCPAFARDGFCKHMVAVALAANAAGEGAPGALAPIRDYLLGRSVDDLVGMIVDQAERDPALLRRLELAAASVSIDDATLAARMRKAIDGATRTRNFVDYERAPRWVAGVDAVLDGLAELVVGPRAGIVVALADHAMTRIETALENIDDSDGQCDGLLWRLRDIHCMACHANPPQPLTLARDLFRREMEGSYGTFRGAAAEYADVLGREGLAEYSRLAREAWEKVPVRIGRDRGEFEGESAVYRLLPILDFFAERDGDVEARIALRAKNLSSPWQCLELAEFCLAHGRDQEALRRAEDGLWIFEDDRPDERLLFFTVDLLLKIDRAPDAEAHLWRAFRRAPGMALYERLRALGGAAVADEAVALLQKRLAGEPSGQWQSPAADLLAWILTQERRFAAAWALAGEHVVSWQTKEALALASGGDYRREALETYTDRVENLVRVGGNPAYEEAALLVERMGALRDTAEQADYVEKLAERHRRKRNFIKRLGQADATRPDR